MDEAKNTEKKNDVKDKSEKDPPADVVQTVPYDVDAALYEQYMDNVESQWRMEEAAKTQEDEETTEETDENTQLLRAKTLKLGDEQAAAAKEGSDEEEPAEEKGRASVKPLEKGKGGVVPRAKQKMEKKKHQQVMRCSLMTLLGSQPRLRIPSVWRRRKINQLTCSWWTLIVTMMSCAILLCP